MLLTEWKVTEGQESLMAFVDQYAALRSSVKAHMPCLSGGMIMDNVFIQNLFDKPLSGFGFKFCLQDLPFFCCQEKR